MDYEKECEEIQRANAELLCIFEADLIAKGLTKKTIKNHIENVDLYINDYLLREEPQTFEKGLTSLDGFFYFFIHKCMWSTPATIRSNAASFKKFYKCMMENGKIDKEDYEFFLDDIKERIPEWVVECDVFNDW